MNDWPLWDREELRERIAALDRSGTGHHAWLLVGAPGVGKASLARWLARGRLCGRGGPGGCGSCGTCRRATRGVHPDYLEIARAQTRSLIPVAAIREAVGFLGLRPVEGRGRVVVIVDADRMNPEAQNALLKTLEEPPDEAALLLTSARCERLLPTVRSRALRIAVPPCPTDVLARELGAAGLGRPELLAELARGSPGTALALAQEGGERLAELCRDFGDRSGNPSAWVKRALGDLQGRQARIDRARWVLRALLLALEATEDRGLGDRLLAALADLDLGLGPELVLTSLYLETARSSQPSAD